MRDPEDEVTNYCKLINWESMFPNSHAGDFLMKHSRTRTFPCPESRGHAFDNFKCLE